MKGTLAVRAQPTAARIGAIILAGGRGSRMGGDIPKPLRMLAGRPLIAHVLDRLADLDPVVINAQDDGTFDAFGDGVAPDLRPGFEGPLAGIEAGLAWHAHDAEEDAASHVIVVPSDTPFLPQTLKDRLLAEATPTEIVVARHGGRLHPTVALWPVALLSTLSQWLDDERPRALRAFLDHAGYRTVPFGDGTDAAPDDPFFNINTLDDLSRAEDRFG
ncbi:molybdenum cofactor guanylyltransferase MobA [Fulvimarina sp. 2208YS6-2-32]|uniref:Molybdenum cofactor guanylyltransferase n=1 Tax=Fulvimarina uroteuthidis TaxID=3098149 RepID=A0ABU5I231_9HYPH|nr:molybdenum cofactor guanylyltransferase MobA [Fulvimarina sp. 2208YS6-2-32]